MARGKQAPIVLRVALSQNRLCLWSNHPGLLHICLCECSAAEGSEMLGTIVPTKCCCGYFLRRTAPRVMMDA
jgi:hypothetical protein